MSGYVVNRCYSLRTFTTAVAVAPCPPASVTVSLTVYLPRSL